MKFIIYTILLFPGLALAEIPNDAVLLFQVQASDYIHNHIQNPDVGPIVNAAIVKINNAEKKVPNLDLNCQTVYREWKDTSEARGDFPDSCTVIGALNPFESRHYCRRDRTLTIDVYCQPRDLQQQQIMSLMVACQKDAKPECYDPKFLEYLGRFQRTKYIDVNKPGR